MKNETLEFINEIWHKQDRFIANVSMGNQEVSDGLGKMFFWNPEYDSDAYKDITSVYPMNWKNIIPKSIWDLLLAKKMYKEAKKRRKECSEKSWEDLRSMDIEWLDLGRDLGVLVHR